MLHRLAAQDVSDDKGFTGGINAQAGFKRRAAYASQRFEIAANNVIEARKAQAGTVTFLRDQRHHDAQRLTHDGNCFAVLVQADLNGANVGQNFGGFVS